MDIINNISIDDMQVGMKADITRTITESDIYEYSLLEMYFFKPSILNFSSTNKIRFEKVFTDPLLL